MTASFSGPGPDEQFRQRLVNGKFEVQLCAECKKHWFYPRVLCPFCGAPNSSWVTPSGNGEVYSTTVVRRKKEQAGDYNVAIIELAEGPRLMSRVEELAPGDVKIGMPVMARIDGNGDAAVLVFVPAKNGECTR